MRLVDVIGPARRPLRAPCLNPLSPRHSFIYPAGGGEVGEDEEEEEYQENAEMLYGLIHARYILTLHGMETMVRACVGGDHATGLSARFALHDGSRRD